MKQTSMDIQLILGDFAAGYMRKHLELLIDRDMDWQNAKAIDEELGLRICQVR
jgi:hypothetical protein